MKKLVYLFVATVMVGGMSSCDTICSKFCDEKAEANAEGSADEYEDADGIDGWISLSDSVKHSVAQLSDTNKYGVADVVVFTQLKGPYTFGTTSGTYNLCTQFTAGSGSNPSKLALKLGRYDRNNVLFVQNTFTYDLGETPEAPYAVKWVVESGKLKFWIGKIDKAISDSTDYTLEANVNVAIKMTDMFPTGPGTSSPALIGAEDIRAGVYDEKKVVSYDPSGIAGLYYASINGNSGTLFNVPISNTVKSIETSGHPIGVTAWNCH